jgi:hypothetical protein
VHFRGETEFIVAVGWILGCYKPYGAYAGLLLIGPQGSMKTSTQKRLCALVDPLTDEPWSPAREERDAMITAQRTHVQPFDNVVRVSADLAGFYCRLSTGGKLRSRQYYTDNQERVLHAKRPVIMTSTRAVITQEDLIDRYAFLAMGDPIDTGRKREQALDEDFAKVWPALLGVILDAVSEGLRRKDDPEPEDLPRMADFAVWVSRCERALGWTPGTFLAAYRKNIRETAQTAGELDLVASTVIGFMERCGTDTWTDSASVLLRELRLRLGDRAAMSRDWPKTPNWLSHRVAELSPLLRRNGIVVTFQHSTGRTITLRKQDVTSDATPGESAVKPWKPASHRVRTVV